MTDDRLEQIIGKLLWAGVSLAAAVVLAGGVWYLAVNGMATADYRSFHRQAGGLDGPQSLILAGLLILIATPVARVIFALVAFALEGDRMFVAISAVVLAVLLYSIAAGLLLNRVAQSSDALDLHFHHVAWRHTARIPRRSGVDHVAGHQGYPSAHPSHNRRAIENQI
jgi:uncharacterized membrane protein